MTKELFIGSGVALVTPFKNDGIEVDYSKVEELIEYHIKNGTDSIIVAGTTGESSTLEYLEHEKLIEFAVKCANGRIPIIAGTGSNNTRKAVELTKKAEYLGADGSLSVTPYYNKCSQKGLIEHYKKIASSTTLPIIIYNVPSRTGVNIETTTAIELSKVPNIIGIKEASGNIEQIKTIIENTDKNFYVYSGNDDQIVDIIELGGKGVISVLANICPQNTHNICKSALEADFKTARQMQIEYLELIKALFCEVNPQPIKEAMNYLGYSVGDLREPLTTLEEHNYKRLTKTIDNYQKNGLLE